MNQTHSQETIDNFELCEQFADYLEVPVDYVWSEFADPSILTSEEIMSIFMQY
jgi:hypothetical protein